MVPPKVKQPLVHMSLQWILQSYKHLKLTLTQPYHHAHVLPDIYLYPKTNTCIIKNLSMIPI